MYWPGLRVITAVFFVMVGGWLGGEIGALSSNARAGALVGSGMLVLCLSWLDGRRAGKLLAWLRAEGPRGTPPTVGLWGEISGRMERLLRLSAQESTRERERLSQFLTAIEAAPNGVLLLDSSEQIEWCNGLAAEHLGLDLERDLKQRITNLVRAPAFVTHLHTRTFDQAVQIPRTHGRGLLSVLIRPYGEGQHLLMTQDVTARERAEATRRDFVANVSHEIRTPLTVLSGFVETMASLPLSEAERHRVLSLMGQQTRRMQMLVGDLLTLARLEGSPRPPIDVWVPLARLGAAVESDAWSLSAGRHSLAFEWPAEWVVAGSESELQSALSNLVNNAVRYTPEGGEVKVKCERRPEGNFEIRVADSGSGIAPEHLARITERFYRVDSSRSRDTGGTGLGLSIVKHVVQRHGGELLISSELGRGSNFTIVLPASRVKRLVAPEAVGLKA
jgi:two-component system phosphate regulon sensor histidine kinase PhoR